MATSSKLFQQPLKKSPAADFIDVICRFRPPSEQSGDICYDVDDVTHTVRLSTEAKAITFDKVTMSAVS